MLACALAGVAPALAGTPANTSVDPAQPPHDTRRPLHTSDGEPGSIALPLPTGMRSATRSDGASWRVAPGVHYTRWDQVDARGPIRRTCSP